MANRTITSGPTATVTIVGGVATAIEVVWTYSGDDYDDYYIKKNGTFLAGLTPFQVSYTDTSFSFDVAYTYTVVIIIGAFTYQAQSNTVTPKQLIAPTIISVTGTGDGFQMSWSNNGSPYDSIDIRQDQGGTWSTWGATSGSATSYFVNQATQNFTYGYAARGVIASYGTAQSSEKTAANWAATITDTLTLTDSVPGAGLLAVVEVADILTLTDTISVYKLAVVSISDTLSLTDSVTAATVYNVTISDTLTLTDSVLATQTIKTTFGYYLAGQPGVTYHYDSSYKADNATAISCRWRSKRIDYADQDPESMGKWKTLFRVRVHYEDLSANTMLAIRVSTDGGATWVTQSAIVGTGDLTIKEVDFFFIKTGRMFNFELVSSSTSSLSKVIALEAEYEVGGEYFAVS